MTPTSSSGSHAQAPPRVWVLPAKGAGDTKQLLALAQALGWPYEIKDVVDGVARVVTDRLLVPFSSRIPARKRAALAPPWPDLVLISGGRSVADARRIRAASGGRARIVCIGRPWAALDLFDLVVTTPQYRLPARANVLENTTPLNPATPARLAAQAERWAPRLEHLPRPRLALLVGGASGSYRFTVEAAQRLAALADAHAHECGGSVLVSTSPRTPPRAIAVLQARLRAPHYCYRWQPDDDDNPLEALLGLADRFIVTGDSAAMLADACTTGRPVALFEPPARLHTRLFTRGRRARAGGSSEGWRQALVAKGLWIPARDMRRYHAVLRARGLLTTIEQLHTAPRVTRDSAIGNEALAATLARIRSWFPHRAVTDAACGAAGTRRCPA